MVITESRFRSDDKAKRNECEPPGYMLCDYPRQNNIRGGGTGIIARKEYKVKPIKAEDTKTYEFSEWSLTSNKAKIRLVVIYRPCHSKRHTLPVAEFLGDLSEHL